MVGVAGLVVVLVRELARVRVQTVAVGCQTRRTA